MARVEHEETALAGVHREEGGSGGQGRKIAQYRLIVLEESQQGRCPVELAVEAGEGGAGEAAAPGLADEGGPEEAPGVLRREAQEDLLEKLVRQRRRRRRHGGRRRGLWLERKEQLLGLSLGLPDRLTRLGSTRSACGGVSAKWDRGGSETGTGA